MSSWLSLELNLTNDECVKQMCSLGYEIQILAHFTQGWVIVRLSETQNLEKHENELW